MNKYLSICIPTNGRINVLKNTLDSIFLNCNQSYDDFEVILSDNSDNTDLELMLIDLYSDIPNIVYSKSSYPGFLNSINALKIANGNLLKLHNNYTMFTNNGLSDLINFSKNEYQTKPLIFFKNSGRKGIQNFSNFNDFTCELSYWNSWSTGISIWKEDFTKISSFDFDKMFPHVSLLIYQNYKKNFMINDNLYFINQEVGNKGGYNLFKTFSVDYLNLMNLALKNYSITENTFIKIKYDLIHEFLPIWYFNTKLKKNEYTFDLSEIKKHISVNYGIMGFIKLLILSYFFFIKKIFIKLFSNIKLFLSILFMVFK